MTSPFLRGGSPVLGSPQVEELPWTGGGSPEVAEFLHDLLLFLRLRLSGSCQLFGININKR